MVSNVLYREYFPADVVANILNSFVYCGKYEGEEEVAQKVVEQLAVEFANRLTVGRTDCELGKLRDTFLIMVNADEVD